MAQNSSTQNSSTQNVKKLTMAAAAAALVCIGTVIIQIPIPFGYMHFGNCMILLAAVYFGPKTGLFAGGVGSAIADLITYPQWAVPTLIIKSLMGFVTGIIAKRADTSARVKNMATLLANIAGIAVMVVGYFVAGAIMYGGWAASAAQIPGLVLEGVIGIGLFYVIGAALEAAKVPRLLVK